MVLGEHATLEPCQPPICAAISLRTYLLVTAHPKCGSTTVTLRVEHIGLNYTWSIDTLPWSIFRQPKKRRTFNSTIDSLDPELLNAVMPHAKAVSKTLPLPLEQSEDQKKTQIKYAATFLYLFLSLSSPQSPGLTYSLRSTIPNSKSRALGFSASVCVCVSTALLLQAHALAGPHPDQLRDEAQTQISRINHWAYIGELCIHRNPMGMTSRVSSYGSAWIARKAAPARRGSSKASQLAFSRSHIYSHYCRNLRVLLVETSPSRSTTEQHAIINQRRLHLGEATDLILQALARVANSAWGVLESGPSFTGGPATYEGVVNSLGPLIQTNHSLLDALGLLSAAQRRVREVVDRAGVGWFTATEAGGGRFGLVLLRADVSDKVVAKAEGDLMAEGFHSYDVDLVVQGVGVLRDELTGGCGEEITKERFEGAEGPEGIEQLVGLHVGRWEEGEGWRFWGDAHR